MTATELGFSEFMAARWAPLWRCSPSGTGCAALFDDPTGTLRLR